MIEESISKAISETVFPVQIDYIDYKDQAGKDSIKLVGPGLTKVEYYACEILGRVISSYIQMGINAPYHEAAKFAIGYAEELHRQFSERKEEV